MYARKINVEPLPGVKLNRTYKPNTNALKCCKWAWVRRAQCGWPLKQQQIKNIDKGFADLYRKLDEKKMELKGEFDKKFRTEE